LLAEAIPEAFAAAFACFCGFTGLLLAVLSAVVEVCALAVPTTQAHASPMAHTAPSHRRFPIPRQYPVFNARASTARPAHQPDNAHKSKNPTGTGIVIILDGGWQCQFPLG